MPFTMVGLESLVDLALQVRTVLSNNISGDFVECGVWRGGASFLMADLLRQEGVSHRKVWLFDSFEGMPPPLDIDGQAAKEWGRNINGRWYFENLKISLPEVQRNAAHLGLSSYTEFIKGWFDQTLPMNRERVGPIALLRIDCDWHSSVRCCLDNLYDQVVDGGFVIFDDYYTWDGCAIAVHEFLGKRGLAHRIESVLGHREGKKCNQTALFRKGKATWRTTRNWDHEVHLAAQEITAFIQLEECFILVDQELFGSDFAAGRHAIPFLERDGQYWGPPPDDATAIQELHRLQKSGANFVVFGWPAFWWLGYYSGFHTYLRSKFPCVLENERLVAFDLKNT